MLNNFLRCFRGLADLSAGSERLWSEAMEHWKGADWCEIEHKSGPVVVRHRASSVH